MAKKKKHEFLGLTLKVKCPKDDSEVTIELSEHDIRSTSQECDMCGSHGDITIDFECPVCGEFHEHELKSW